VTVDLFIIGKERTEFIIVCLPPQCEYQWYVMASEQYVIFVIFLAELLDSEVYFLESVQINYHSFLRVNFLIFFCNFTSYFSLAEFFLS